MMKEQNLSRRRILQMSSLAVIPNLLVSCSGAFTKKGAKPIQPKINMDIHWARRQEWNGAEFVFGVVRFGEFTLMVQRNDPMGWTFPGGVIDPKIHGPKSPKALELVSAAAEYILTQASVSVLPSKAVILSYGYLIDEKNDRILLAHWVAISPSNSFPPPPHADLHNTSDARWVTLDDPKAGNCLRLRMEESIGAGEGASVIYQTCRS